MWTRVAITMTALDGKIEFLNLCNGKRSEDSSEETPEKLSERFKKFSQTHNANRNR